MAGISLIMDVGIGIGGLSTSETEITSSKYDLFSPIYVDRSIRKNHSISIYPNSSTDGKGPFVFDIPADPGKFTDVETLRLHGRMRIRKKTVTGEEDLAEDEQVSTINNIFDFMGIRLHIHNSYNVCCFALANP